MKFDLMALLAQSAAKWGGVVKYDTDREQGKRKRKDGDKSLRVNLRKGKKSKHNQVLNDGNINSNSLVDFENEDNVKTKQSKTMVKYTKQNRDVDRSIGSLESISTCSKRNVFSQRVFHVKTETNDYCPADKGDNKLSRKPCQPCNVELDVHSRRVKIKEEPLEAKVECKEYKNGVSANRNTHSVSESKCPEYPMTSVTIKKEVDDDMIIMKLLRKSEAKVLKSQEKLNNVKLEKDNCSKDKQERRRVAKKEPDFVLIRKKRNVVENYDRLSETLSQDGRGCESIKKAKRINNNGKTTTKKLHVKVQYTKEEDDQILNAIETYGDNLNYCKLAKQLGRTNGSVHTRVKKLRRGERSRKQKTLFTLEEDLLIMDSVLPDLHKFPLKDLVISSSGEIIQKFSTDLNRNKINISKRWRDDLQPWILQYYNGTLNLDIRRMLLNYLKDTFGSRDAIDWLLVAKRPDFVGHTESSLRRVFFTSVDIVRRHEKLKNLKSEEITLNQIADVANECFNDKFSRRLSVRILRRQTEVIDHFKNYIDKHGITNFI